MNTAELYWEDYRISSSDRMLYTLFLAAVFHAVIIFGVVFKASDLAKASSSLEITLVATQSQTAPKKPDFLAQTNQEGSGTLKQKTELSTDKLADIQDNEINDIQPVEAGAPLKEFNASANQVIHTEGRSPFKTSLIPKREEEEQSDLPDSSELSMLQRSMEIASLEAQLREKKEALAKRPRKRQLTAISAKESHDAMYLDGWRQKIETVGNLNYPEKAREQQIYGSLRLMVAVNGDGTIHEVEILKSSGQKILDDAALRIVRMAAPFEAFPQEIKQDTDVLEIIRTWQFTKGNYLSSQ